MALGDRGVIADGDGAAPWTDYPLGHRWPRPPMSQTQGGRGRRPATSRCERCLAAVRELSFEPGILKIFGRDFGSLEGLVSGILGIVAAIEGEDSFSVVRVEECFLSGEHNNILRRVGGLRPGCGSESRAPPRGRTSHRSRRVAGGSTGSAFATSLVAVPVRGEGRWSRLYRVCGDSIRPRHSPPHVSGFDSAPILPSNSRRQ